MSAKIVGLPESAANYLIAILKAKKGKKQLLKYLKVKTIDELNKLLLKEINRGIN